MDKRYINRDEIEKILTQDSHYRKKQIWPLLTSENFNLITSHKKIDVINMLNVKLEYDIHFTINDIHFTINDFSERIDKKYKFVNKILNKFKGHLVACGGSIINTLIDIPFVDRQNTKTKHSDLDLFFYDLNIEEANKMRINVISDIISIWKSYFDHNKFIIKRNEFVTSVYIFDYDKVIVEYQLIHRIYPDISSIIGVRV